MHHLRPRRSGHRVSAERRALIHRTLISAAALISVATLAGCTAVGSLGPTDQPIRDDEGQIVESNRATDAFALLVGDCVDALESLGEVSTMATLPCNDPHEGEVYASVSLNGTAFPGAEALVSRAEDECRIALELLVGVSYFETPYDFVYLAPTANSWLAGDREILCVVFDPSGPLRGPVTSQTLRP